MEWMAFYGKLHQLRYQRFSQCFQWFQLFPARFLELAASYFQLLLCNQKRYCGIYGIRRSLHDSVKLPQVFMTPITKNSTRSAYAITFSASLMPTITFQIPPPLKFSGLVVNSVQISVSFPFHVSRDELRLSMIQFPLEMVSPPVVSGRAFALSPYSYQPVISVRISLVNVMTMPPATVRMPLAR